MKRNGHHQKTAASHHSFRSYYCPWPWRWNPLVNHFLTVIVISLFVFGVEEKRIVVEMQSWSLDSFWAISHLVHRKPAISKDIFIVAITDSDYRNPQIFNSGSPLDPYKIKELLAYVLSLDPAVVGVDLDTKDRTAWSAVVGNCTLKNGLPNEIYPISDHTAVVWARMPAEPGSHRPEPSERPMQLYQVLGGCAGHTLDDFSGVPLFPLDADGVVRKYVDQFKVDSDLREKRKVGSLAYVIAAKKQPGLRPDPEKKILNFGRKKCFPQVAAGYLLGKPGNSDKSDDKCSIDLDDWKRRVSGNILLIGGEFEDSRDSHDSTPAEVFLPQPLYGVELNAMAIDADLHGGTITVVPKLAGLFADLMAGTLFVWIFFRLLDSPLPPQVTKFLKRLAEIRILKILTPRQMLFLAATISTFLIAIILSGGFYLASFWLSFIPILVGANLHQYIAHLERVGKEEKHTGAGRQSRVPN
jgi:CHASE2 domain-containing sensor protein